MVRQGPSWKSVQSRWQLPCERGDSVQGAKAKSKDSGWQAQGGKHKGNRTVVIEQEEDWMLEAQSGKHSSGHRGHRHLSPELLQWLSGWFLRSALVTALPHPPHNTQTDLVNT